MWIPLHSELKDNPKVINLCDLLDINEPEAIGYLTYLWWFTATYADDGNLSKFTASQIERYCQWRGEKGKLFSSFIASRFIENNQIKDWYEHTGIFIERAKKQKERMRIQREKHYGNRTVMEQKEETKETVISPLHNSYITDIEQINNGACNIHTYKQTDIQIDQHTDQEKSEKEIKEEKISGEVEDIYSKLTGNRINPSDYMAITKIVTSVDTPKEKNVLLNIVKNCINSGVKYKQKKNENIGSFNYFSKSILSEFQKLKNSAPNNGKRQNGLTDEQIKELEFLKSFEKEEFTSGN